MKKKNYRRFARYVKNLTGDIYAQPPDAGHTAWAFDAFSWIMTTVYAGKEPEEIEGKVLDVGCGQAFMSQIFEGAGLEWTGIAIGEDVQFGVAKLAEYGLSPEKIREADMTFLPFKDEEFDLIFARHVLEHSPFPIISLMEWRRVAVRGGHLCLVAPAPHWWKYQGRNHYSIVPMPLLKWWCERAGWKPIHEFVFENRNPLFLKHLGVYQTAISSGAMRPEDALDAYPPGPVEFRLICRASEEVTE
jgi:SAM-dependent methyltransferase